jgi:hypothetical protein
MENIAPNPNIVVDTEPVLKSNWQKIFDSRKKLLAITATFFALVVILASGIYLNKQDAALTKKSISDFSDNDIQTNNLSLPSQMPAENAISTPIPIPTSTPVITGTLSGKVEVSFFTYSKPLAGIKATAKSETATKITTTDSLGKYYFEQLPIGFYTVTFDHPDYRFPNLKMQVNAGNNVASESPLGLLTNPQPLNLTINAFVDNNKNNNFDAEEESLNASMTIYKKSGSNWQSYQWFQISNQNSYSLSILPVGEYKIEPGSYTFYTKPGSQSFIVDGYGGNKSYLFAYIPTVSEGGIKIYVFNDKNENSIKNPDEEYIHYQYARITNAGSGTSINLAISASGSDHTHIEYGTYNLQLIPENSSWEDYYKITKGNASVYLTSTGGQQTVELGAHKLY